MKWAIIIDDWISHRVKDYCSILWNDKYKIYYLPSSSPQFKSVEIAFANILKVFIKTCANQVVNWNKYEMYFNLLFDLKRFKHDTWIKILTRF